MFSRDLSDKRRSEESHGFAFSSASETRSVCMARLKFKSRMFEKIKTTHKIFIIHPTVLNNMSMKSE